MSLNPYRRNTQLWAISELLLQGKTREQIFRETYPLVLAQSEPFVFSDNVNGNRVPKPVHDQIPILFYRIGIIRAKLLAESPSAYSYVADETGNDARNYNSKAWRAALYNRIRDEHNSGENNEPFVVPEPAPSYVIPEANGIRGKLEKLHAELNRLRVFVQAKRVGNREFDFISTRAFVYGKAAILAGIEVDDFLVSIGLSWSPETRKEARIKDSVDYSRYPAPEGMPKVAGFVLKLIEARIPVYLYGPTGSGKSYVVKQIAEWLEMAYGEIPLSCGVSRTDLLGNWNANGFVTRPFATMYDAEGDGGIFCLEEIDAVDPNILLTLNNAIANDELFNSSNGETIERHERFTPVATANTLGNGASANYAAREGLDGSSLDRFKYGRVFVDYDSAIEAEIIFGNIEELESAEATL